MFLPINILVIFYVVIIQASPYVSNSTLPTRSAITKLGNNNSDSDAACPSKSLLDQATESNTDYILNMWHPCGCGNSGWTKVAHLNYSIQPCPHGTYRTNNTDPNTQQVITGCGIKYFEGSSLPLPMYGVRYSMVCGKIQAFGFGNAFSRSLLENPTIDDMYMEGVSLTHGPPGNRKHIWSFVAAFSELYRYKISSICRYTNTDISWPYQTPWFVGSDYFCDTNSRKLVHIKNFDRWYRQPDGLDVLWDGKGCGPTSSCCTFNNPPYFCKKLNYTTTEDIEMRFFLHVRVSFAEIYIK